MCRFRIFAFPPRGNESVRAKARSGNRRRGNHCHPSNSRSLARLEAENGWRTLGEESGKPLHVLRLAGVYGPGRNALEVLRNGTARRIVKPGQVFNRIHVSDIARAIAACFAHPGPGGVWNVADDEPAPPRVLPDAVVEDAASEDAAGHDEARRAAKVDGTPAK